MPDKLRENVTAPRGMYMHRAIRKKKDMDRKKTDILYGDTGGESLRTENFFGGPPPHHLLLYI
jgi:hypothetical protein